MGFPSSSSVTKVRTILNHSKFNEVTFSNIINLNITVILTANAAIWTKFE
jgi:hypothetical protein